MLLWLRDAYPQYQIEPPRDEVQPAEALRHILCSKQLPSLGVTLRPAKETVLDMAATMLEMGAVRPKLSTQSGTQASERDEL